MDIYVNPATGDIDLQNHTMRFTNSNAELTVQRIRTTLLTYRGEWFFNINEGIPYLENANNPIQLIGKAYKEDYDPYVKQAIGEKPFVTRITSYSSVLDPYTSELRISFNVQASDQAGTISVENINIPVS